MIHRWFIEPRDPVVVREGRSAAALDEGAAVRSPLPSTIAGLIRACLVHDPRRVSVKDLLDVHIVGGPWLGRWDDGAPFEAWVPAPADAVRGSFDTPSGRRCRFRRGALRPVEPGVIALWPPGARPSELRGNQLRLVRLPGRDDAGQKTRPAAEIPGQAFWSLVRAVRWATSGAELELELAPPPDPDPASAHIRASMTRCRGPVLMESRIHVSLDDKTGTAEPGMIYGTPGLRFEEGFGLAVELDAPDALLAAAAAAPRAVHLGGEGRVSYRRDGPGSLPRFEDHAQAYEDALTSEREPAGLRLQLITPAWLSPEEEPAAPGWLPSWARRGHHPSLPPGLGLEIVGMCIPHFIAISGWDMQWKGSGGPRAVRRLVPAGSVLYFHLVDTDGARVTRRDALLGAARALWAEPIEPWRRSAGSVDGPSAPAPRRAWPDLEQHVAHPASDGFGRILPGFFWDDPTG